MERMTGIEPALPASEASGLSVNLRGQSVELYRIRGRRCIHFFYGDSFDVRDCLCDFDDERWLIPLPAMRHRSQVRCIGFDHHLRERTMFDGLSDVCSVRIR